MDRARLIKLMMLTTSDQDGEALSALRMANRMLSKERKTWENILNVTHSDNYSRAADASWTQNQKGNWVRFVAKGEVATVFYSRIIDGYTHVFRNKFGKAFATAEEAKADFDAQYT